MSFSAIPVTLVQGHLSPSAGFEEPFEMLSACHERVERMLRLLGKLRAHVRTHGADEQASQAARDVMRYFDQAGPRHHEDEELHVFPPLMAQRDPAVVAVVVRLLHDHREMAELWPLVCGSLLAMVEAGPGWGGFTAEEEARLDAYDALYQRHLLDENGVAYPAARPLIRGPQLQAMGQDMMARRGVV